jgi:hypothetical protein
MKRRDVIGGLSAIAVSPRSVMAEQSSIALIGFLNGGSPDAFRDRLASIKLGMAEVGFVDGNNISWVSLWADGRYDKLPNLGSRYCRQGCGGNRGDWRRFSGPRSEKCHIYHPHRLRDWE